LCPWNSREPGATAKIGKQEVVCNALLLLTYWGIFKRIHANQKTAKYYDGESISGVILPYEALAQFMLHIVNRGALQGEFLSYLKRALLIPGEWITPQKTVQALREITDAAEKENFEDISPVIMGVPPKDFEEGSLKDLLEQQYTMRQCPQCKSAAVVDVNAVGQAITCPKCQQEFTL